MPPWIGVLGVLVALLVSGCVGARGPFILSGYGSMEAAARTRAGAHPAIDYGGNIGDRVLAAADGKVVYAFNSGGCGNGIRVWHEIFNRYTLYCHLAEIRVRMDEDVVRGQVIGLLGTTGEPTERAPAGAIGIPQLHFELAEDTYPRRDGQLVGSFDPLSITVGCFDAAKAYPLDRLVLTHPVVCQDATPK